MVVSLVRSVFVEFENSMGSSVETTGEGSESTVCGCDLEMSPSPQFKEVLGELVFSFPSVLTPEFMGPKVIKVTSFKPCGVINQG